MKRLDHAVPVGLLIGAVTIIGAAAIEGITPRFLLQPTAALIVIGGTLGATVIRRGMGGLIASIRASLALRHQLSRDEFDSLLTRLSWLSRTARREGVHVLENHARSFRDPLVSNGLSMIAAYTTPEEVRRNLDRMLEYEEELGLTEVATLEAAGGYAPTFGVLGAVIGLIHVLRMLANPTQLGAGIATAFVATLYGIGFANLLFLPLAARLRDRHDALMKQREAIAEALVAIAANESPTTISQRMTNQTSASTQSYRVVLGLK